MGNSSYRLVLLEMMSLVLRLAKKRPLHYGAPFTIRIRTIFGDGDILVIIYEGIRAQNSRVRERIKRLVTFIVLAVGLDR